jgi:hypothetical protein
MAVAAATQEPRAFDLINLLLMMLTFLFLL